MNKNHRELLILTSPPASGKTYWIKSFHESLNNKKLLVISPLRALAEECKGNWENEILIMTPEEWIVKRESFDVVIFDEFHLFFYWGDTFRPQMWEAFFDISQEAKLTILLTATLSKEMQNEIQLFSCHFHSIIWVNQGNQTLRYKPSLYLKAPNSKWLFKQIEVEKKNSSVKLIFCRFREEVFHLEKKLNSLGFICVSCVGGESREMAGKLKMTPSPDFIISTTVLSHGVNLPKIRRIYFLYLVEELDFWIQMVARGGRKGEDFDVFSLNTPVGLKWSLWKNYLTMICLTLKRNLTLDPLLRHFFISE